MTKTVRDSLTALPITITFGTPEDFALSLKKRGVAEYDDIDVHHNSGYALETVNTAGDHQLFVYISRADWSERYGYETIAHEAFHLMVYIQAIMHGCKRELIIFAPQHEGLAYHLSTIYQSILDVVIKAKASESTKVETLII